MKTSQRRFEAFEYQAATWPTPQWIVVKCEANAQGTNRRAASEERKRPVRRVLQGGLTWMNRMLAISFGGTWSWVGGARRGSGIGGGI